MEHIQEHQKIRMGRVKECDRGLEQLGTLLSLKERPVRLEAYDIAVHQGSSPAASRIVFMEGRPDKKHYRHYHLRELPEGNNDFAMMKETIGRRLKGTDPLPDVFVVDGGKAQVNVFVGVLTEMDVSVPVIGVAKAPGRTPGEERLVLPNRKDSVSLKKYPELMKILLPMRDEAHRFSRRLHHKAEKGRMFSGLLDSIKGIGPKKQKEILTRLETAPQDLAQKKPQEVAELLGLKEALALKILERLWDIDKAQD